ncbi:MAG: ABC transporter ATP-binding protein [Acidimicrobiales bacterium]|jgi:branched-chain amino acid transport system ATP-binding protein|nr:ABC transporter ATP-binding protein [Acidimicrobiales bacterium]|tara:strand:- start:547 stop:1365 length:819 start_codon:yes stop_codon:yes gene_type:complete
MTPLLKTEGLTVTFGGLNANDGVDLIVEAGSFVGLIGPNGAGKTTFIDAITGYVPASSGTANFDGHDLSVLKPHKRSQLGLVRTFQSLELFEDLSVRDNLLVAAHPARWYTLVLDILHLRQQTPEVDARVDWALEVVGLSGQADVLPTDLSHGQRKLVGVARALAPQPKLVLFDEPAAGLDTAESSALGGHLRGLLDHDITVFLVDHDMGLVLSVCDYIYVMDFGRVIAAGTPTEIRTNPDVRAAYLGKETGEAQAHYAEELHGLTGSEDER